jgi:hypothetical protein
MSAIYTAVYKAVKGTNTQALCIGEQSHTEPFPPGRPTPAPPFSPPPPPPKKAIRLLCACMGARLRVFVGECGVCFGWEGGMVDFELKISMCHAPFGGAVRWRVLLLRDSRTHNVAELLQCIFYITSLTSDLSRASCCKRL